MPQLSELIAKKKFVKKEFRPWDLSGKGTIDGTEKTEEKIKQTNNSSPSEDHLPSENISPNQDVKKEDLNSSVITNTGNNSGNILDNKQVTTRERTSNNQITPTKQRDNIQVTIREQSENRTDNNTGNTEFFYLVETIKKLSGIQKNIFYFVINVCSARGSLETGHILSTELACSANCSIGSAKTSLIRLIEKQLILRLQGKASRGGHMVLGVTKEVQSASIQAQQALFNPLKTTLTDNVLDNRTSNSRLYSSSSNNKNNTTTILPDEWKAIDYDLLTPIGFSESQLRQLYDSKTTTAEIVQDAINRFAYSLEHNTKTKSYTEPLNVLMGILRKGQRWNEPNYVSAKEKALQEIVEEKRRQKERQELMIKDLIELEFPTWRKQQTELEIQKIVPADILKMNVSAAITASLRTHFIENILLPKLKKDGLLD